MALTDYISVRSTLICVTLLRQRHSKQFTFEPSNSTRFRLSTEEWVFINRRETTLSLLFRYGKIRGTLGMRSHISVHRATTKYFSNSFVFKNEIEKEGLPGDITPALGAGGPEFKSRRPDH